MRKLELRIGRVILPWYTVLFFLAVLSGSSGILTLICLACAALHELGHVIAARLCGVPVLGLIIYPCGGDMRLGGVRSYFADALISVGGAAANVMTALVLLFLSKFTASFYVSYAVFCSAALAILNMLPINGLDGGDIVRCLLNVFFGCKAANKVLSLISGMLLFALWIASVYIFLICDGSPSLFFMVCGVFAAGKMTNKSVL